MTVAIYSGSIPSTVFIENLIRSVARPGTIVYLFGSGKKIAGYGKYVRQYPTPSNPFLKSIHVASQMIVAIAFNLKNLLKLLQVEDKNRGWRRRIHWLARTVPVVNHLPDVFHIQWAKSAEDWLFLKDVFQVKLVLSLRGAHINYSPGCDVDLAAAYCAMFPRFDGFHAVSKAIAKEAEKYGASPERTRVIYSGIRKTDILKPSLKTVLNRSQTISFQPQGASNILSVGRLHWIKGYNYAIDACAILRDKGLDFHYTIISSSGMEQEYRFQIQDLGLDSHVTIAPGMSHDRVLQRIVDADLMLVPSMMEGVPNVALEAMSLGTPVLSTRSGGIEEVIQDGREGFLVEACSATALAEGIERVCGLDQPKVRQVTQSALEKVEKSFTVERLGDQMVNFYSEI